MVNSSFILPAYCLRRTVDLTVVHAGADEGVDVLLYHLGLSGHQFLDLVDNHLLHFLGFHVDDGGGLYGSVLADAVGAHHLHALMVEILVLHAGGDGLAVEGKRAAVHLHLLRDGLFGELLHILFFQHVLREAGYGRNFLQRLVDELLSAALHVLEVENLRHFAVLVGGQRGFHVLQHL